MSWYGDGDVDGTARRRLPQPPAAARIEPGRKGCAVAPAALDATHGDSAAALALLDDPALDALLAPPVDFEDLPAAAAGALDAGMRDALCPLIRLTSLTEVGLVRR